MERYIRVRRRRTNIVDLVIYHYTTLPGITGYQLKASTNFDSALSDIITTTNIGYVDPNVNRGVIDTQPINGVRVVFDPDSFSGAGLDDTKSFWLQVVPLIGAVEQSAHATARTLVLPDRYHYGIMNVVIAGQAPTTELRLDMPMLMEDFRFINEDDTNDLYVGFEEGGPKYTILPQTEGSMPVDGNAASLYFQADTAAVDFTMVATLAFPR